MRSLLLCVALIGSLVEARPGRFSRLSDSRSSRGLALPPRASGDPLFEFAPASGAGMPATACTCANPTGTHGETLMFSRASSAYCTKGNTAASIANGDLVACSTDQARVMPGGDGTGALGLLMELTIANRLLRSSEIDNATWSKAAVGIAAPTITADYAVGPDGATTADRMQGAACPTVTNLSVIEQASVTTSAAHTISVYLKGTSGSGSITLYGYTGVTSELVVCNYVSTSWTRCSLIRTAASSNVGMGCLNGNAVVPGTNTGAFDVLVAKFQAENNTYATSPIDTTSAVATRASDLAYFTVMSPSTAISMAATRVGPTGSRGTSRVFALAQNGATYGFGGYYNAASTGLVGILGAATTKATVTASLTGVDRFWESYDGTTTTVNFNGTSATGSGGTLVAGTHVAIGYDENGGVATADGVIKLVCMDSSSTRCR